MTFSIDFNLIEENIISKTVATEMDNRLRLIKTTPDTITLMGADFYNSPYLLNQRYPKASLTEIEPDCSFLQASQRIGKNKKSLWHKLRHHAPKQLNQSFQSPLTKENADIIWSNLSLQKEDDLKSVFSNWANTLKTEGMLFMSTFGPETLKEIYDLLQTHHIEVDRNKLWDMHDMGDMLAMSGFTQPITDMSKLIIDYQNPKNFWEDILSLRLFDAFQIKAPKETYYKIIYDAFSKGHLKAITLEIVYAHALKKTPSENTEQIINFYPKA